MTDKIKLAGIAGSLRKGSFNAATLRTLAENVGPDIEIGIGSADLPLFNEDIEKDPPQSVKDLRQLVADSDGVLFVTPEYNHGMSGVTKNALDWLSRPPGKSAIMGKQVGIISVSMAGTGGVRAQQQLKDSLMGALAIPVVMREVAIGTAHEKVKDGKLADQASLDFAVKAVKTLADAARKAK